MSILRSCARNFTKPACQTYGFPNASSGSTQSPSSPPANSISKNAMTSRRKIDNNAAIGKKASRLFGQTGLRPVEQPGRLFDMTAEDGRLPKSNFKRPALFLPMRSLFYLVANHAAAVLMKVLFG